MGTVLAAVSFKSKYIAVAVITALVVSVAVGSVLALENRSQHNALLDSAAADSRERVLGELALRADEIARRVSERVDAAVLAGDRAAIGAQLETLKRDPTLLGVVVRDTAGRELFAWRRNAPLTGNLTRSATTPVRANVQTMPGIDTPQTVGEAEIEIRSLEVAPDSLMARNRFDSVERNQLRKGLLIAGGMGGIALILGLTLAWWAGRRMRLPISTLIKSADRIAHGDYSRPLEV